MFLTAIAKNKNILQEIGLEPVRHTEFDVKACMLNCAAVSFREMIRSGFPDAGLMVWAYTGQTLQKHRDILRAAHDNDDTEKQKSISGV